MVQENSKTNSNHLRHCKLLLKVEKSFKEKFLGDSIWEVFGDVPRFLFKFLKKSRDYSSRNSSIILAILGGNFQKKSKVIQFVANYVRIA